MTEQPRTEETEPKAEALLPEQLQEVAGGARNGNLQITQFYQGSVDPA
jgi:hypothetical protein